MTNEKKLQYMNDYHYTVLKGDYPYITKIEHLSYNDVVGMLLECAKKDNWDMSILCEETDTIPLTSDFGGYTITDGSVSLIAQNGCHTQSLWKEIGFAPYFHENDFQQIESWCNDISETFTESLIEQMVCGGGVEPYKVDYNTINTEYHRFIIMEYNDMNDDYIGQEEI